VVFVVEVLVIIQYSVLADRKCSNIKGGMNKVMKTFICRGCVILETGTGCTSIDIGVEANLKLVVQLWRTESELDGINS